eukprot:11960879-Karenia_brevis.AAC.1
MHVGVMVSLQDEAQTPPYVPTLLRPKRRSADAADISHLRNLRMQTVSWPYRKSVGKASPSHSWLQAP